MGNTKSWSTFFPPTHDLFVAVHSGAGAMASLPPKLSPFSLVDGRKALIFSVSILLASLLFSEGLEVGSGEDGGDELFREILRDEAVSRINQLGKISDADGYLERTFLSPGSIRATDLIMSWMQDAGLKTWVDQMGNLHGRTNAINATAETLLIGSHLDTVVDAGKYDGSLGIVCAISALKVLKVKGKLEKLYRPVEVEVSGAQGHAGTVPMLMRQDPMAAAAELVVTVESLCKYPDKFLGYDEHCGFFGKESFAGLVCTVGEISCWPSASNVIPGQVNFTVDIRAIDDEARELVVSEFSNQVYRKCEERMVNCTIEHKHNAEAAHCDSGLSLQLKHATSSALGKMLGDIHSDVPILMSGAGHDAMAMSHLTKVGMLFVRCRGGISHSPEESVLDDDVWAAGLALLHFFDQHVNLLHF
ncbi:allantoate deiminase 2-like isoform X3 [Phoenix dactylifera]|uniref:allantoate deiminase n=1 Tax=Phoenix dactylifera TaxID=42345 RepID=A0A8B9A495_PHODC|nr:allantoate deiminase 2-like isoform X3 [Phoenix dactylifera]